MRFVDAAGKEVDSSLLEVTSANTLLRTIILSQTLYPTRSFPLDAESLVSGTPAKGYAVRNVSVSPAELLAAGTAEALDLVDLLYASAPVDLTGATETFTQTVRIRKPSELAYVSNETVTVTVEIEPVVVSRSFENVKLSVRGTGSGLKASAGKKNVSMVLTGPELLLGSLRESNVTAYVDASGLKAGEHDLPVLLHIEKTDLSDVTWLSTPATVTVTLTETQS
jgi:YbbR domain-containing protein